MVFPETHDIAVNDGGEESSSRDPLAMNTAQHENQATDTHNGSQWSPPPRSPKRPAYDDDESIQIGPPFEDDGSVANIRKSWMVKDSEQRQRDQESPKSERRGLGASDILTSPGFAAARSKWESNPPRRATMNAPMSWHPQGGKKKWAAPPTGSLTPSTTRRKWGAPLEDGDNTPYSQGGKDVDESSIPSVYRTLRRSTEKSQARFTSSYQNELNVSVSSLACLPPMPRRRRDDDEAPKQSATATVVRGSRVYNIEQSTRKYHPDYIPRDSAPTASRSWIKQPKKCDNGDSIQNNSSSTMPPRLNLFVDPISEPNSPSSPSSFKDNSFRSNETDDDNLELDKHEETVSESASIPTFAEDECELKLRKMSLSSFASLDITDEGDEGFEGTAEVVDEEFEVILNDGYPEDEEESESESEHELDDAQHDVVNESEVREFVVDRVPMKKRWSSRNINESPVWPPIIRVEAYEAKQLSGVSIGSGFTEEEDLTNDFLSSLGDDDFTAITGFTDDEEFTRKPPEKQTSYRIRYGGPTNLKLDEIYKLPPVPANDNRFEPISRQPDGAPSMPARDVDSAPRNPPRRRPSKIDDDDEGSLGMENVEQDKNRPDVWITPLSGTTPTEAMWKVKRVWALDEEDDKEREHSVHNGELFEKIKTLVGAPESPETPPKDGAPKMPSRSWHVQAVVERRGRLQDLALVKQMSDSQLNADIKIYTEDAVKEMAENARVIEELKKKREERRVEMLDSDDRQPGDGADKNASEEMSPNKPETFDSRADSLPLQQDDAQNSLEKEEDVTQTEESQCTGEVKEDSPLSTDSQQIITESEVDTSAQSENCVLTPDETQTPEPSSVTENEVEMSTQNKNEVLIANKEDTKIEPHPDIQKPQGVANSGTPVESAKAPEEEVVNESTTFNDNEAVEATTDAEPGTPVTAPSQSESGSEIPDEQASTPVRKSHRKSKGRSSKSSKHKDKDTEHASKSQKTKESERKAPSLSPETPTKNSKHKKKKHKKHSKTKKSKPTEGEQLSPKIDHVSNSGNENSTSEIEKSPATPKKRVIRASAMVYNDSSDSSSDSDSEQDLQPLNSPLPPRPPSDKEPKTPKEKKKRISAAAMVHDSSDSELDVSDDDSSVASPVPPKKPTSLREMRQSAGAMSPWWKKNGASPNLPPSQAAKTPKTPKKDNKRPRKAPDVRSPPLSTKKKGDSARRLSASRSDA